MQHRTAHIREAGAHHHLIIIIGRRLKTAAHVDYGNMAIVITLHVTIAKSELAQQFNPSYFKPDDEVRMIDHTHLVRLRVADTEVGLADDGGMAHLPVHIGLRFSRKELTPSLKSAVVRMRALSSTAAATCSSNCDLTKPL